MKGTAVTLESIVSQVDLVASGVKEIARATQELSLGSEIGRASCRERV